MSYSGTELKIFAWDYSIDLPSKPRPNSIYIVKKGLKFNMYPVDSQGRYLTQEEGSGSSTNEINDLSDVVTWATVPNAFISESSVVQHESALTITESQISDLNHFSPTSLLTDYGFVDNSGSWNTAYFWGDHSTVGYLTSADLLGYLQSGDNISELINDLGFITTYVVTEADVTQYEGALSITKSQIPDFDLGVSSNSAVTANTAKVGVTVEEANTIDSITSGEPIGSDQVVNVVSLTQAEYDAGSPNTTTFYIITDA